MRMSSVRPRQVAPLASLIVSRLELAWDSFSFYSKEVLNFEPSYQTYHFVLDSYLNNELHLSISEKKNLHQNLSESINSLYNLYYKQIHSLDEIQKASLSENASGENGHLLDFDSDSLSTLKGLTLDLISQLEIDKNNIQTLLM
jgi:hypothetical protein